MKVISWENFTNDRAKITCDVAVAIGVFDGVHIGHRKLLEAICKTKDNIIPLVITFKQNPLAVIDKTLFKGSILSIKQKLFKLELFGIEITLLIDFSSDFSKITGKDFWNILTGNLSIKRIVAGKNFSFGYKRAYTIKELKKLVKKGDFKIIEPLMYKGEIVSSTRIRNLIQAGCFDDIREMMCEDFSLDLSDRSILLNNFGQVEIQKKNIRQVIPKQGIYKVILNSDKESIPAKLIINDDKICFNNHKAYNKIRINNILFIDKE